MGLVRWLKRLFGLRSGESSTAPSAPLARSDARSFSTAELLARLSAVDVLARVRQLQARNGQWPEIWSQLNPGNDSEVQQLLVDLRNDGLQFAPSDGLNKIEQACLSLSGDASADAVAVLRKSLGRDILDRFR